MNILGLSFDYHDSAAVLLKDGVVAFATQEERLSRQKNTSVLPALAIEACLRHGGLTPADIDAVAFYEDPIVKLDRVVRINRTTSGDRTAIERVAHWIVERRLDVPGRLAELGFAPDRIHMVPHHASHAASAFFCSPFDAATIVTLDGVGEWDTGLIARGQGTTITPIARTVYPHSLGLFYSAFTSFLGFEVNEGEYKVMGLAPYGQPRFFDELMALFELKDDGTFLLDQTNFTFSGAERPYSQAMIDRFGPPRPPGQAFSLDDPVRPVSERDAFYTDLAASVQKVTEEVVLHIVRRAIAETGLSDVCLAGGVALNSVANGRLQRELGCRLYVQPAAGDAGGALGAAQHHHHVVLGRPRAAALSTPYQGQAFSDEAMLEAILASGLPHRTFDRTVDLIAAIADRLAGGAVVGWFQGRTEWGPRALGARSILASPARPEMKHILNEKIKFREMFRPFAPAITEERAADYFDLTVRDYTNSPEHLMISVCHVHENKAKDIPAIVHVDGSARVQIVSHATNPLFHDLLTAMGERTGIPVLINTSFNLKGEPIVNAPEEALLTFLSSGMDGLAIGKYFVTKG